VSKRIPLALLPHNYNRLLNASELV
jgi:hypothetical protein